MRGYLEATSQLPERSEDLTLTAVAVINPRTTMPQDLHSSALLDDYASMVGPGCDITLALLPLPCGDMTPTKRRTLLAASTRALKLSPASYLLRAGANLIVRRLGLQPLIALYTHVLAKFTTYVSNVVAPPVEVRAFLLLTSSSHPPHILLASSSHPPRILLASSSPLLCSRSSLLLSC